MSKQRHSCLLYALGKDKSEVYVHYMEGQTLDTVDSEKDLGIDDKFWFKVL